MCDAVASPAEIARAGQREATANSAWQLAPGAGVLAVDILPAS
jgi:hypothetical protein